MIGQRDFLAAYEQPRLASLGPNLAAACFPLMKLLPARFMLAQAFSEGHLKSGGHVVETTSGTFGMALAMVAAVEGYELTLVSAKSLIDERHKRQLELLGAEVQLVDDFQGSGAQSERLALLSRILRSRPGSYWPRQYDNPRNLWAYSRLAEWIIRDIGRVDCLVGCVGSGGSLCGTGVFLREVFPDMKIIAVDTHNSVLFGHEPGRRLLRGLGNSVLPLNLRHDMIDEVHWVGATPAIAATHRLYREHALFVGPTSGAAALAANWYAREHPTSSIVTIFPDEGWRYQDTVYSADWLATIAGWPSSTPDAPDTLHEIQPRSEGEWTRFAWNRLPHPKTVPC